MVKLKKKSLIKSGDEISFEEGFKIIDVFSRFLTNV